MTHYWHQHHREAALEHLQQSSWLREVRWLAEVDSTNSLARRELASSWDRWPALFVADRQTAGRGRATRQWWSPMGCLMCSFVVGVEHVPDDSALWPQLSLVTGVAVAEVAQSHAAQAQVQLKWPNDVFVDGRKLAGILVEAMPRAVDGRMSFIIGIGINVAVDWSEADPALRQRACSLAELARQPIAVEQVLIRLTERLQVWLESWQQGQWAWREMWTARSLLTGCHIQVRLPSGRMLEGVCQGIDASGCLLIQISSGIERVQSADVIAWHSPP
jgi:BirA family biotin operon repressor/biotin-[acetyl-CoA-carboxylase] ligase